MIARKAQTLEELTVQLTRNESAATDQRTDAEPGRILFEAPWELAEQVLEWVERDFAKSEILSREAALLKADQDGYCDFHELEYRVGVSFSQHGSDLESADITLSIEINGHRVGWLLTENLDAQETIDRLRSAEFAKSLFQHLKSCVQTKLELSTPPHSAPAAKAYAEQKAAQLARDLKEQLEVRRHPRSAQATAAERRSLLESYLKHMGSIESDQLDQLPALLKARLAKRAKGGLEPGKIVLRWTAKEQGLKYKPSYLEKVLTQARKENSDLVDSATTPHSPTLESPS